MHKIMNLTYVKKIHKHYIVYLDHKSFAVIV